MCHSGTWYLVERSPDEVVPYPASDKTALEERTVSWLVLIVSGVLEAVWATALSRSEGFTRPVPSVTFGVALVASMAGLAYALKDLPVGTAYAVWVGVGASLTVAYGMWSGTEAVSLVKIALIAGIVACVAGLKILH